MLKKLKQALGKIVKKIKSLFSKKENKNFEIELAPGTWYINGNECNVKFTSLENNNFETTDFPAQLKCDLKWEADLTGELDLNEKELEKMLNTSLTNLPKCYPCKALILSVVPNSPWEGTGVDMSQYEEKGLAHFFVCRKQSQEELLEEYWAQHPESTLEVDEEGMISAVIPEAILLEYEDGIWDYI